MNIVIYLSLKMASFIFYFSFIVFILLHHLTIAQLSTTENILLYANCTVSANYTATSTYEKNLNALLSGFSTNISKNGYYNASFGNNPDSVTAIALCRGDIELNNCRSCVDLAIRNLTESCPTVKEGIIWYEYCMFRYTDQPVSYGTMIWGPGFEKYNTDKIFVSDQVLTSFLEMRRTLFNDLRDQAASSSVGSLRKYATADDQLQNLQSIYSLVQCTPDLSGEQCRACINAVLELIPKCCNTSVGGAVYKPTCNIRYELGSGSFYGSAVSLVAPSPPPGVQTPPPGGDNNMHILVIISVSIVAFFVILVVIYFLVRLRKNNIRKRKLEIETMEGMSTLESLKYDFDTVKAATDNFSADNKLGEGGFGPVYKGTLPNGHIFAVKRLSQGSSQGEMEFKNEVLFMAKLQHRNLVRLLGFCLEGAEKLLIYEFVVNGSLDHVIFDQIKSANLNWEKRYKIVGGIARGLLYLHEDSRLRIIHRDLKASNILLDEDMSAKIADFGIARCFGMDESKIKTNRIAGTFGYMAPEVLQGNISPKTDVYSFGVLVLEIVSGKKVSKMFGDEKNAESLLTYAWKMWGEGTASKLIDENILQSSSIQEIMRCIHIGLLCVQENVSIRPTMSSVVTMLSSISITLAVPSTPAFVICNAPDTEKPQLGVSHNSSVNSVSITELYGR